MFKKTPVFLTILYRLITLGIYTPCWFITRCDQINELNSKERLNKGPFVFVIVIACICFFLSFVSGFVQGFYGEFINLEALTIVNRLDAGVMCLSWIAWIILVVQRFKVKRIFIDHFNKHLGEDAIFCGFATFFFNIHYLQYKINRFK